MKQHDKLMTTCKDFLQTRTLNRKMNSKIYGQYGWIKIRFEKGVEFQEQAQD